MNKAIIYGLIISLIILVGCSDIPDDEIKQFCKSLNMTYISQGDGKFSCSIRDSTYLRIKEQKNPYKLNYTDCYERKFVDDNKYPKCKEWCNEGIEYDWDSCYHNCINTWRICKQNE